MSSLYEEGEYSLEELLQHPERSEYFYHYTKESWEEEKELLQARYVNIKSDDDYETYLEMVKDSWMYFKTLYPSIEDYQKICEDFLSQVFPKRTFRMHSATISGSRWIMPDLVASHSKGIAPHVDFWYQLKQDGYIVQNRFNRVLIRIGLCDGYIYKVLYSEDIFKDVPRSELEQLKKKEEVLEKVNDPLWHRKILATIMAGYRNTGPELSRAFFLPPYVLQKTDPLFVEDLKREHPNSPFVLNEDRILLIRCDEDFKSFDLLAFDEKKEKEFHRAWDEEYAYFWLIPYEAFPDDPFMRWGYRFLINARNGEPLGFEYYKMAYKPVYKYIEEGSLSPRDACNPVLDIYFGNIREEYSRMEPGTYLPDGEKLLKKIGGPEVQLESQLDCARVQKYMKDIW